MGVGGNGTNQSTTGLLPDTQSALVPPINCHGYIMTNT